MEDKLKSLEFKKVMLFNQIESLSEVSGPLFEQFGKICVEIMTLKKAETRLAKNTLDED